ncbi:UNVERIFIED_CONTAM: RNA polymerase sigma-70 factor (ECF subfamily) [Acetivibrio alkalicellulosi]
MLFIFTTSDNDSTNIDYLIDSYSKSLMRLCYIYLKDYHLAEDAVQETLFKAYKSYKYFRKESSEKTWITKIAINTCKSYLRKYTNKEIVDSNYILLDYESRDEETKFYRTDEAKDLLNAIYNLPQIYKQVILLKCYLELSISEISKIIKQKENTVSVRLKRAKEILKKELKEEVI